MRPKERMQVALYEFLNLLSPVVGPNWYHCLKIELSIIVQHNMGTA